MKQRKEKALLAILVLFFILVVILLWYFFDVRQGQGIDAKSGSETAQLNLAEKENFLDLSNKNPEVGGVVEKVSRHILLPAKSFTVATVNDASGLWNKSPVLFQYVRNGQKLLLYDTGIVVYDPQLDKVVDIIQFYSEREKSMKTQ